VTFDPATRTVYVADNNANTVSVLDAAGRTVAALPTGRNPVATVLDARTRTLYATNVADGTVSVFDVTNCNADRSSGCGPARATVDVGEAPLGITLDPVSDAVYVGHDQESIAVIDGTTCNRAVTSGCSTVARASIAVPFPFADPSTRTIYLPGGSTTALINARTCAHGCTGPFPTTATGNGGYTGGADPATHTVYVANADDNTVSVLDGARCNATNQSGCGDPAPAIPVGPFPASGVVVDDALHTLYVIAQAQDLLSVVDTAHCRAADTSGCDRAWPALQTGGVPVWSDLDPRTHTL
jgi:YVTN family beta-propeller protein